MPKCSHCEMEIPAGFMGLYCPKCGKALWSGIPDPSRDQEEPVEGTPEGQSDGTSLESEGEISPEEPRPAFDSSSSFRMDNVQTSRESETNGYSQQTSSGIPIRRMEQEEGVAFEKSCPWEDRDEIGAVRGFFQTIGQCIFHPNTFFSKLPPVGALGDPALFAIIMGIISALVGFFWSISFKLVGQLFGIDSGGYNSLVSPFIIDAAVVVLTPIIILPFTFIMAGIYHVGLMIVKGANKGYTATFKVICYSLASNVLGLFPFCGPIVASIWSIVLISIGLSKVHETSIGKGVFAALLPLILMFLMGIALALVIVLVVVANM